MGKHNGDLLHSAREHVFALFRRAELPVEYHQLARTREIVDACKEIAKGSNLDDGPRETVLLCAWFYDACYAIGSDDHVRSRELCVEFLEQQGARRPTRDQIAACFNGVEVAERAAADAPDGAALGDEAPSDVLHDGKLAVLASEDYVARAEILRLELERRSGRTFSDVEWTQHCIAFFGAHPFRTRFAQLAYGKARAANLAGLQKLLRRQRRQLEQERADETTFANRIGKNTETFFYHFTRINIGLVGLADRRTSTMIQVNAIMISVVVALLVRHLDTNPDLVIPTILLLCVNVAVVFLAIHSMRSGRRRAPFGVSLREEEARVLDDNLLAVTNEMPMSLSEYAERMDRLSDPAQFQRKVIESLYFGRKVLVERTKTLRLTYRVFLYGIALAVVAFAVVLARR